MRMAGTPIMRIDLGLALIAALTARLPTFALGMASAGGLEITAVNSNVALACGYLLAIP